MRNTTLFISFLFLCLTCTTKDSLDYSDRIIFEQTLVLESGENIIGLAISEYDTVYALTKPSLITTDINFSESKSEFTDMFAQRHIAWKNGLVYIGTYTGKYMGQIFTLSPITGQVIDENILGSMNGFEMYDVLELQTNRAGIIWFLISKIENGFPEYYLGTMTSGIPQIIPNNFDIALTSTTRIHIGNRVWIGSSGYCIEKNNMNKISLPDNISYIHAVVSGKSSDYLLCSYFAENNPSKKSLCILECHMSSSKAMIISDLESIEMPNQISDMTLIDGSLLFICDNNLYDYELASKKLFKKNGMYFPVTSFVTSHSQKHLLFGSKGAKITKLNF